MEKSSFFALFDNKENLCVGLVRVREYLLLLMDSAQDSVISSVAPNDAQSSANNQGSDENNVVEASTDDKPQQMSKKARKKLARMEKRLATRKERRKLEKMRRKERRRTARENGVVASRHCLKNKITYSKCHVRVAIDLSYEDLMNESDLRHAISQLNFAYAANRRAMNPLHYYIVNLHGTTKNIFTNTRQGDRWDVYALEESLEELWSADSIVYLSAESENVLTELDDSKVYVIGGLVDHNAHKGICYKRAVEKGFNHARLPIDEFVKVKTRKVLAINHVFEILLHYSESKDWEKAFFSVIPMRKGVEKIPSEDKSGDDSARQTESNGAVIEKRGKKRKPGSETDEDTPIIIEERNGKRGRRNSEGASVTDGTEKDAASVTVE